MLSKRRFWVGLFVIQILLFYLFSRWSGAVYFVDFLFEQKKYLFQSLFSKIPFSIGDVFYFVLGLLLVFSIFKLFNSKTRKVYSLRLLKGLNVFYFVYQLVWGMTYFQRPIVLALDEKEPQITEIKALALKYLHQAKHTRMLVKEDGKGVFQIQDLEKIKREILSQQKRIPAFLGNKNSTEIDNFFDNSNYLCFIIRSDLNFIKETIDRLKHKFIFLFNDFFELRKLIMDYKNKI